MTKSSETNNSTSHENNNEDVTQNFLNNGGITRPPYFAMQQRLQLRGLNNTKQSPDSGWTFPSVNNSPMIQQGMLLQQQANFIVENSNAAKTSELNLPLNNPNNNYNNYNAGIFKDAYQTRLMSPLVEMNLRQQQMQQYQQQQQYQQLQQRQQKQIYGNAKMPYVNGFFDDGFMKNNFFNTHGHGLSSQQMKSNAGTPVVENKEQTLPPFSSFASSIPPVKGSPQFHAALAAQMNSYFTLLQKSQIKLSNDNFTCSSKNEESTCLAKDVEHAKHQIDSKRNDEITINTSEPLLQEVNSNNMVENNCETVKTNIQLRPKRPTLLGKHFTTIEICV